MVPSFFYSFCCWYWDVFIDYSRWCTQVSRRRNPGFNDKSIICLLSSSIASPSGCDCIDGTRNEKKGGHDRGSGIGTTVEDRGPRCPHYQRTVGRSGCSGWSCSPHSSTFWGAMLAHWTQPSSAASYRSPPRSSKPNTSSDPSTKGASSSVIDLFRCISVVCYCFALSCDFFLSACSLQLPLGFSSTSFDSKEDGLGKS